IDDFEQGPGAADRPPPGPAAGAGRGDPQGAGEEARTTLPRRHRLPPSTGPLRAVNRQPLTRTRPRGEFEMRRLSEGESSSLPQASRHNGITVHRPEQVREGFIPNCQGAQRARYGRTITKSVAGRDVVPEASVIV